MPNKKDRPVKPCALCHEIREMEESHIVPKFVVRYLKKTAVGEIRSIENINAPVQDSEKHYLLCGECEDLFSTYETKFANTFFHPYMSGDKKEFHYDKDTYYFLTSVSWRSLYMDILDFVQHPEEVGIDLDTLNCLIDKEKEMRNYLLHKQPIVPEIEHHVFFLKDVQKISQQYIETRPNTTMHGTIGSYTIFSIPYKTYGTLTLMLGILVFTIYNKGKEEFWENTEIKNEEGIIKVENQHMCSICSSEILEILKRVKKTDEELSDKQKEAMNKRFEERQEKFLKSRIYEDLKKDFDL